MRGRLSRYDWFIITRQRIRWALERGGVEEASRLADLILGEVATGGDPIPLGKDGGR